MTTSVIDKDRAHQLGSQSKEVSAILPIHFAAIDQPQKRFMHKCGRLQSVTCTLASHVAMSETVQFFINKRHQLVERCHVAPAPVNEELSHFVCLGFNH